jgi:hypothetical protein
MLQDEVRFKNRPSGKKFGGGAYQKECVDSLRSAQFREDFLSGYHQRCGSIFTETANDDASLDPSKSFYSSLKKFVNFPFPF